MLTRPAPRVATTTFPSPTARVCFWRRSVSTCSHPRRRGDRMRRQRAVERKKGGYREHAENFLVPRGGASARGRNVGISARRGCAEVPGRAVLAKAAAEELDSRPGCRHRG